MGAETSPEPRRDAAGALTTRNRSGMQVKVGNRLRSVVCDTEVIVTRAPTKEVEISCGGHPMVPLGTEPPAGVSLDPDAASGAQLGKRYADEEVGLELLVTKAGKGTLALNGTPLEIKQAKALPSSD